MALREIRQAHKKTLAEVASELGVNMTNQLKEKRKALNLTQKQVAEKIGVQWQVYQRYEKSTRLPNVLLAIKIAKTLKTPVEALWCD